MFNLTKPHSAYLLLCILPTGLCDAGTDQLRLIKPQSPNRFAFLRKCIYSINHLVFFYKQLVSPPNKEERMCEWDLLSNK